MKKRSVRGPTGLFAGPRDRVVEAILERDRKNKSRRVVLSAAVDLASADENFRRDLLDKLKALGAGRRGRLKPATSEKEHLKRVFKIALDCLANSGRGDSDNAAARYVVDVMGLYPGTDPETLLRRYKREMKKR